MAAQRCFYVTQDAVVVWYKDGQSFHERQRFASTDEGFHAFASYLRDHSQIDSLILIDVIEEEFTTDTIPKLPARDRTALIARRLARRHPRTPYRLGHFQGRRGPGNAEQQALYSAITNPELLDPWLELLMSNATPVAGIFSVPLLANAMLKKLRARSENVLLLTQHQDVRLRLAFLRDGELKSARLSQSPPVADGGYGDYVFNEILRSRRYLERGRLLGGMEEIDVFMITDPGTADAVVSACRDKLPLRFNFIRPESAAKALRIDHVPNVERLEALFIALAAQTRGAHNYALRGENRFHRLAVGRRFLVAVTVIAAVGCSLISGLNFAHAWRYHRSTSVLDGQIRQMEETFRRDNEQFAPLQADSHEMKLAVDSGDFILRNRLPVAWVMQQVSGVLGGFPQVQIDRLEWRAEGAGEETGVAQARRGEPPPAIPIRRVGAVRAELAGQLVPFDGDMRRAFAEIDRLAAALQAQTDFQRVSVTEFPLDARPSAAVSGEVVNQGDVLSAFFRISLELQIAESETDGEPG